MKCYVFSWNVRGLGNQDTRRQVKDLLGRYKPDITILQEMKLTGVNIDIIIGLCSFDNPG